MTNRRQVQQSGARQRSKRSQAYHHGDLRVALLAAARRILEEEGLAALSLRSTARAAGVSAAAPYHHFVDKDALLAAVATQGFEELAEATKARMSRARGSVARLRASGVGYVSFAVTNPALFGLMFTGSKLRFSDDAELGAASQRSYAMLEGAVRDVLQDKGGQESDAPLASLTSWAVVHGLAKLLTETELDPATYGMKDAEALAERLLAGIRM